MDRFWLCAKKLSDGPNDPVDEALNMEANEECVKRFVCSYEQCSKTFSKAVRLKHHLMTHSGERPHVCDVGSCNKSYTRAAHLKRHIQVSHGDKPTTNKSVGCTHAGCSSMFASQSSMIKHVKSVHEGVLKYKCIQPGCDEAFRKRHQLKAHQYHHRGVLPFQCEHENCHKKFSQKSHLDRHQKQHEGYRCSSGRCDEVFPVFSLLVKHQALCHSQSKDHLCPECGKTFHSKSWLKQHQKTHSDNRTLYKCPEDGCPRAYLDMRNLTAHLRSYHDSKKFICEQEMCGRAFASKQKLEQHQKLHTRTTTAGPKKYPNKGHQKKDVLTCLTGVSKETRISMATETMDVSSDSDCDGAKPRASSTEENTRDKSDLHSVPSSDSGIHHTSCSTAVSDLEHVIDIRCQRLQQLYGKPDVTCHSDGGGGTQQLLHSRT